MAFSSEVFRWDDGHAASAAAFLADATNKLSAFSVQTHEYEWLPKTDNTIDPGETPVSLDGYSDEIGNDVLAPWLFVGRTSRQVAWLMSNRFNGGDRSYPATVGVFNQDTGSWSVYTCVATWRTSNSINNLYRDVTIEWTEAEVLA